MTSIVLSRRRLIDRSRRYLRLLLLEVRLRLLHAAAVPAVRLQSHLFDISTQLVCPYCGPPPPPIPNGPPPPPPLKGPPPNEGAPPDPPPMPWNGGTGVPGAMSPT
uniref:Uncharacterized protein n=1 Tax=Pristionchus pacificus TaxID=54126 RepID=A0A2A6BFX2_PRIPA|eukprot:PDM64815.1 hypothetical protein PRIPAC_53071 [Pristionchus pacificus]